MITVNVSDKLLLHSCKSPPQHTRECSTCHHLHKTREQLLICLLLAWLLLAVSQLQGSQINVQATESGKALSLSLYFLFTAKCIACNYMKQASHIVLGSNVFTFFYQCQQFKFRSRSPMPRSRLPNWVSTEYSLQFELLYLS